jgi:hypothetical protein
MNCQKFEGLANELARGQMMEVELRSEAEGHSANCPSCSAQLRDHEMLSHGLRLLGTEMNELQAPNQLEAGLLSAFREAQVVKQLPVSRNHRRYWLAAVAALLLIVFSVIAFRMRNEPVPVQHQAELPSSGPKDSPDLVKEETPQRREVVADNPKPVRKHRPVVSNASMQARAGSNRKKDDSVVSNHATNEVATEFMPVGYLSVEALQDGGQIVRVELPRTALVKFGLPVNMDRYNERVKADVLIGLDGLAHAIRFVQEKRSQ